MSLVPSATEMLASLGKTAELVGVTENDSFPPEVLGLPKVGDLNIDFEKLLSIEPDLVILDSSFNKDAEKLRDLGVESLVLNCQRLGEVSSSLLELGSALGCEEVAKTQAQQFTERMKALPKVQLQGSVFVEVWSEPLMTVGSNTLLNDLIEHLGMKNAYADQNGHFPIDPETLLKRAPKLIILPTKDPKQTSRAQQLLSEVSQETRVIRIDPDLFVRPGPRLVLGLEFLSGELQPR